MHTNFLDNGIYAFIFHTIEYIFIAGAFFIIFYIVGLKRFDKNKIQSRQQQKKEFLREAKHSFITLFMLSIMWAIVITQPVKSYTLIYSNINDFSVIWLFLSVVIALIIHDTYFYWMHRFLHHPRFYKKFHLVHHYSSNPSPWASYSFHIFEGFTESLIVPILVFILPIHELGLLLFSLVAFAINVYGHLGYEIAPKWFRNSILFNHINSSVYHNMHHKYNNVNYGLYFRFWDKLMKTEAKNYEKKYDRMQKNRFEEN